MPPGLAAPDGGRYFRASTNPANVMRTPLVVLALAAALGAGCASSARVPEAAPNTMPGSRIVARLDGMKAEVQRRINADEAHRTMRPIVVEHVMIEEADGRYYFTVRGHGKGGNSIITAEPLLAGAPRTVIQGARFVREITDEAVLAAERAAYLDDPVLVREAPSARLRVQLEEFAGRLYLAVIAEGPNGTGYVEAREYVAESGR